MSALSDYMRELRRQRDLLEAAADRDSLAMALLRGHGMKTSQRRYWTRQDQNRLALLNAVHKIDESKPHWFDDPLPEGRTRTRLEWFLGKYSSDRGTIRRFHHAALTELRNDSSGAYAVIAPLLVEATEAHEQLIDYFQWNERDGIPQHEWGPIEVRHDAAIEALGFHQQAETTTGYETPAVPSGKLAKHNAKQKRDAAAKRILFEAILIEHHQYQQGRIGNTEPASLDRVVKFSAKGQERPIFTKPTLSRLFQAIFGSFEKYEAACRSGTLEHWLRRFAGEEISNDARQELIEEIAANRRF